MTPPLPISSREAELFDMATTVRSQELQEPLLEPSAKSAPRRPRTMEAEAEASDMLLVLDVQIRELLQHRAAIAGVGDVRLQAGGVIMTPSNASSNRRSIEPFPGLVPQDAEAHGDPSLPAQSIAD